MVEGGGGIMKTSEVTVVSPPTNKTKLGTMFFFWPLSPLFLSYFFMIAITHLRLAYNLVQILTPITSLTTLHHLQVLDLCDNQLEILPPELGLLTRLKELYLSNNKLYKLPDTIQRMARLEVLDVRNNQFYLLSKFIFLTIVPHFSFPPISFLF